MSASTALGCASVALCLLDGSARGSFATVLAHDGGHSPVAVRGSSSSRRRWTSASRKAMKSRSRCPMRMSSGASAGSSPGQVVMRVGRWRSRRVPEAVAFAGRRRAVWKSASQPDGGGCDMNTQRLPAGGSRLRAYVLVGRRGFHQDADLVDAVFGVAEFVGPVVAGGVVLDRRAGGQGDHRFGRLDARLAGDPGALGGERLLGPE